MARGGVILPILSEFKPQGLDKAIREFEKLEKTSDKIAFGLKKSFVPAAAVVGGLTAGFVKLSAAAETASTSNARIVQVAESMALFGDETQQVTDRLIKLAEQTARNTGVDQNAIKETQAKLLTFKELAETADVVGGSFDRATQAAIDLAAAGFGEATTNAVQLGKALNDPIKGITALTRSGVTFTKAEQDRIRVLVESNKVGEAQTMILEAIEKQVGGTAEATANASDKMNVSFSLMQEKLGTALLPIFEKFTQIMIGVFDFVSANQTVFLVLAGAIGAVATAIVAANIAMKVYTGLQAVVKVANTVMGTSFQFNARQMGAMVGKLGLVSAAIGAAVFVYQDYQRAKNKVLDLTAELVPLLDSEAGGFDAVAEQQLTAILASEDYQGAIEALGISSEDYLKFIKGEQVPGLEVLEKAYSKGVGAVTYLADELGNDKPIRDNIVQIANLTKELGDNREALRRAAAEQSRTKDITEELSTSQSALADTFRITDDTSKAMADSMAAAEAAMAAYEDQTRAANDALQAMMDTTLAMFDADLNLEAQIARTEQAVFDYAEALANGSLKGRDLEAAQRGVKEEALRQADAAVKAAEAQAELAGQTLDASDRQRIMVESLAAVADALDPADPLRRQLVEYIQQLGLIPSVKETVIRTIREEIVQQSIVQAQQFSPAAIAAASRTPRVSRNIGGPVPGIVNASTPIMAHGGEYVLSADVVDAIKRGAPSRGLGRGSAAGDGGGNVINVTVTSADPQAVVDAIRRYNRSNGPAPIRVAS